MTAYFDDKDQKLREIKDADEIDFHALEEWELTMVWDVTICAELGLPDRIRDRIHRIVLKWGVCSTPLNAPPVDIDSVHEHIRRLEQLSYELHSAFHTNAKEGNPFGDKPLNVLRSVYTKGEERRERMIEDEGR